MNSLSNIGKSSVLCVALLTLLSGAARAAAVFFEDDFESYTSAAVLPTTGPWDSVDIGNPDGSYSWARQLSVRESNNVYPGDGSRTVPQSPFGSGGKMLEYYDNYSSPGRSVGAAGDFNVSSGVVYPIKVAFDYRVDEDWANFGGVWRMTIDDKDGGAANGYFIDLIANVDADSFDLGYVDVSNSRQLNLTLDRGVWHHIELLLEAPNGAAEQPGTISVWE
ncbi:MAG: hypothetical protein K9N51_00750 [Candidatus Pacebacteria bacterium]|nr:hypothetical protein [Candidatus Paceibacterota bacterium]